MSTTRANRRQYFNLESERAIIEDNQIIELTPSEVQLSDILESAEKNFAIIKDYLLSQPRGSDKVRGLINVIMDGLERGYNFDYYFNNQYESEEQKVLIIALHQLVQLAYRLKPVTSIIKNEEYLLNDHQLSYLNSYFMIEFDDLLGFGLTCNGSFSKDDLLSWKERNMHFNQWCNSEADKLSEQELDLLFNLSNSNIIQSYPRIIEDLSCFFSSRQYSKTNFILALRKIIQEGKTDLLYLQHIRSNILALAEIPGDQTEMLEHLRSRLYRSLNIIIAELKDQKNYSDGNNEKEFDIELFNLSLKQVEISFYAQHYKDDQSSKYKYEIDRIWAHRNIKGNNQPMKQLDYILNYERNILLWLELARVSGIERYRLLFNNQLSKLFCAEYLKDIYKVLTEECDHDRPTQITINCFTEGTIEYEIVEILEKESTDSYFKLYIDSLRNIVYKYKKSLIEKELVSEATGNIPISSSISLPPKKKEKSQLSVID